jgi:ketosteroid isomerase-like protein
VSLTAALPLSLERTRTVSRGSGARVDMPVAHVLTFQDGRCIKSVTYVGRDGALAAAGLRG